MVTKLTKSKLKETMGYNKKEHYLLMPNEVFEIMVKDVELNRKNAPHIAFAYSYLFLITWLYRYAKYGMMASQDITKANLFRLLGVSSTSKEYDYIIKKAGVLDRLGLTATLSYTEAPIRWRTTEEDRHGYPEFFCFNELDESIKKIMLNGQTTKRLQIKEPLLATGFRNPLNESGCDEEYNGTFYEEGKQYTHLIDFEVFLECMSNKKLGYSAFYLYAFMKSRMGADSVVAISLDGITKYSGVLPSTRDKYLRELKGFGLIGCLPENYCIDRAQYHTEPNTYWMKETAEWLKEPNYNFPKRKVYHVSTHTDYERSNVEISI